MWLHDEILNLVMFQIFKSDELESRPKQRQVVWQFESNLLSINVDDKPVTLGLAWPWP